MVVAYFAQVGKNPPGFFIDEASIAYNAHTIAQHGVDEHGQHFPLYFRAFGEYKSPVYIYALAAVFRFTGPSVFVARLLSAMLGLSAAVLFGLLAFRITSRRVTGMIVFIAAALTPWLFEVSRLVFEVTLLPTLLALFLLLLHSLSKRDEWPWQNAAGLALLLGLMVYSYSAGRLLAPLFALGLVFFVTRQRWRAVVFTWIIFALTLAPLAVFSVASASFIRSLRTGWSSTGSLSPAMPSAIFFSFFRLRRNEKLPKLATPAINRTASRTLRSTSRSFVLMTHRTRR